MFKTRSKFLCCVKVLAVVISAFLLGSCSSTMKMYSGPERPATETALIRGADATIDIVSCDGTRVTSTAVAVLPGEHRVEVSYSHLGSEGYSLLGTIMLRFTAETGHTYIVDKVIHAPSSPGMSSMFIIDHVTGKEVSTGMTKPGTEEVRLRLIEISIKEHPNNAEFWASKGYLLGKLKRYEEALPTLERATVLKPDFAEAWFMKSMVLCELKRYDEALTAVDKAIQLRPNEPAFRQGKQDIMKRVNSST
jgi:hypothetical protein